MKKVAFAVYRGWAHKIFQSVQLELPPSGDFSIPLLITTREHEFELIKSDQYDTVVIDGSDQASLRAALKQYQIDTICFYGWSWMVKEPTLSEYTCLCLHPSPLPRYRGGSPIQNQLVAGETTSAVSIIKMSEGIDDGDIYIQIPVSFEGYLPEILDRIVAAGIEGTNRYLKDLISDTVEFLPQQNLDQYQPLKRRAYEDGELMLEKCMNAPYVDIYNLVRGLQPPYPSAYINFSNGILEVKKVEFAQELPTSTKLVTLQQGFLGAEKKIAIATADGFAIVTDYTFRSGVT